MLPMMMVVVHMDIRMMPEPLIKLIQLDLLDADGLVRHRHVALLENVLLALGVRQLLPVALARLARHRVRVVAIRYASVAADMMPMPPDRHPDSIPIHAPPRHPERVQLVVRVVSARQSAFVTARVAAADGCYSIFAGPAVGERGREEGDVAEEWAQRGQRAGDQTDAGLDDGPECDVGEAVEVVVRAVVVEEVAEADEGGGRGASSRRVSGGFIVCG